MYNIGDSVVYPMHGAGVIEGIEVKEVLGKEQSYYVMRIPIGDMKVMIPMANAKEIGMRDVIDRDKAEEVMRAFRTVETDVIQNWSKRFRDNMVRIKSGNIFEVSAVVKSLMLRDKQKGLSTGERKMLSNAKQIMISEIVVATGNDRDSIEERLSSMIDDELSGHKAKM
ncbi:MAG: CarD family transcriptional regulator [Clostridia bacterium]|nr:CarD family transcriptional regulator [Clostridia bacterium]